MSGREPLADKLASNADHDVPTSWDGVHEVTPHVAFGFGRDESFSPTRWRF